MAKTNNVTEAQAKQWVSQAQESSENLHLLEDQLAKMKAEPFSDDAVREMAQSLAALSRDAAATAVRVLCYGSICAQRRQIDRMREGQAGA